MAELELDSVESRGGEQAAARGELLDDLVDAARRDRLEPGPHQGAGSRRADDPLTPQHAHRPRVTELGGDAGPLAVHQVREARQAVPGGVVDVDLGRRAHAVSRRGDVGHGRHRRAGANGSAGAIASR